MDRTDQTVAADIAEACCRPQVSPTQAARSPSSPQATEKGRTAGADAAGKIQLSEPAETAFYDLTTRQPRGAAWRRSTRR